MRVRWSEHEHEHEKTTHSERNVLMHRFSRETIHDKCGGDEPSTTTSSRRRDDGGIPDESALSPLTCSFVSRSASIVCGAADAIVTSSRVSVLGMLVAEEDCDFVSPASVFSASPSSFESGTGSRRQSVN